MPKKKFIHGTRHAKMRELLNARQATRIAVVEDMPNGGGSRLEFWLVHKHVVIIQFWSGEGVDIYSQAGVGHTWEEVEIFLDRLNETELTLANPSQTERLVTRIAKLEAALKRFAECELNESNCTSLELATRRIRARATEALAS